MNLDEIKRIRQQADCLASPAEVEHAITHLAARITAALEEANPLVFTVMNGGLIFAGRLLAKLDFPLEASYLHATRYGEHTQGQQLHWRARPDIPLTGRIVLILDDILDEGHTLLAIQQYLKNAGASRVLSAVLVHKQHERKASPGLRADFTGLELADRFLFGCGMDYKGYWRNAPGIYAIPNA